jgi:hypothetical protein
MKFFIAISIILLAFVVLSESQAAATVCSYHVYLTNMLGKITHEFGATPWQEFHCIWMGHIVMKYDPLQLANSQVSCVQTPPFTQTLINWLLLQVQ